MRARVPPALPAPKTKFDVWHEAQLEFRFGVETFQFAVLTNFSNHGRF